MATVDPADPDEMDGMYDEDPAPAMRPMSAVVLPLPVAGMNVERGPAPDIVAALETQSQAVLASIAAFQEAERQRTEEMVRGVREDAERRIAEMEDAVAEARYALIQAEEQVRIARSDADDVLQQFSLTLEQVRSHAALVDTLRQENDSLAISASVVRKEADWAKEQWNDERERVARLEEQAARSERRAADAELVAVELRSEVEALRRMLAGGGVRAMMPGRAGEEAGTQGTAIFPVQVTAVVDCKAASDGDQAGETGVGVVFDVRLVAAIPQDHGASGQGVENAIGLARALFPTAPLSVVVGEACDPSVVQSRHADVTFIAASGDDSRRKAARVLASAASHLHRSGSDKDDLTGG
jgi:hypothetical protein